MTFTVGGHEGFLNGTTVVVLVPPPTGTQKKVVRQISIFNRDTGLVTITLSKRKSGTLYTFDYLENAPPSTPWRPIREQDIVVLEGTDESIVAVMSAAPVANQPSFVTSWVEE